jgi:hypothetical protein
MDLVSFSCRWITTFPNNICGRGCLSPSYIFGTFVKNEVGVVVWVHIWVLYSVPLVFMSVLVPVPCCFYCYYFVIQFEVRYCDTSSIALFAEYCLGYSQSLVFPNELQGRFFNLLMKVIGILMGIALNV